MSQLTFTAIPGFFDLADSAIAGNQPLTDDSLQKISHNAKFAAVRCEVIFMGFYANGNTVPAPVSPVDGYVYSRAECVFIPVFVSPASLLRVLFPGRPASPRWPMRIIIREAWWLHLMSWTSMTLPASSRAQFMAAPMVRRIRVR